MDSLNISVAKKQEITVSPAESEQKIFQFLQRRLNLPKPLIHRWIRKGKIRCNGLRIKPFVRVNEGDIILVPQHRPFSTNLQDAENNKQSSFITEPEHKYAAKFYHKIKDISSKSALIKELDIVYEDNELLVCNKPTGLPTHLGSKHSNSLITIIHGLYGNNTFKPTPIHRLDKDTSGLLLIALSYKTLRNLQEAFKEQEISKEYLTWVEGKWKHEQTIELKHKLEKKYIQIFEKVHVGTGKDCICLARPLFVSEEKSLLQIGLITGRTHQIRAQLANHGFPLCGDMKYGGKENMEFKLHAFRLIVPNFKCFELLPAWTKDFEVKTMPKPLSST